MAANRGCRLRKSRRRKPGGDFGRFGLVDAKTGKEVFGFGKKGLTATVEEIEAFLRGDAAKGWKSSLAGTKASKRSQAEAEPAGKKAKKAKPESKPKKLVVREARPRDAEAIAGLLASLGYDVTEADAKRRLARLKNGGEPPLVAERGGVVGCLTWHITPVVHRPRPVGRITMMVVAEAARGGGIGTALVAEAETRLRAAGCGLIEVTSNVKRLRAHNFYEKLGYERTSYRFARVLQE
jgi:ribosomal protein S18 acetylase RimI-like enzyme